MKTIYAILPCYNEAENIGKLIDEWNKQLEQLQKRKYNLKIVAIDDCSTDDTQKQILIKKKKYKNVEIIIHNENRGLCGGLNSAIHYFNKEGKKGDLLVLMDGDNTHDPKYVHSMLNKLKGDKNCIIASRYREGSNIVGLAKNREKMSDFAKLYYQMMLNIPNVKDYTCGYRMYTYELIDKLLKKFGNNPIKEKSFACMMELLYKVYQAGGKFDEVGFELRYDNKCGESKMKVLKTARRSITTAIKLKIKYNKSSLIILIALLLFTTFLSLGTNYSPTNHQILNHDCSIFSYVGFAMQKGRILYSEVWENKGPLLYFIYYVGLSVHKLYGIYLIEWLSIFVSVLFSYKTIKIITNKKIYSLIGIIYSFSVWGMTFEKGTLSESFALPLICVGMFLFTKYLLKNTKFTNWIIMLFGVLTGLIAQLRLNLLAIFLALFIAIGIKLITEKSFKEILRWLLYGIIGVILSLLPTLIYLISNKALLDCLNSAYLNILKGFNVGSFSDRLNALSKMINIFNISCAIYLILAFLTILCPIICIKKRTKKEIKLYCFAIFLSVLLNLYANSIAGVVHMHYFMTFIPIIVMVIGVVTKLIDKIPVSHLIKCILLTLLLGIWSYKSYSDYCVIYLKNQQINPLEIQIDNYINNNSKKDDLVQLIGGHTESVGANFRTKRLSASKYNYLPLWNSFTEERKTIMTNEVVEDIKENKPKLIFIYNQKNDEFNALIEEKEEWTNFLQKNYYIGTNAFEYIVYVKKDNK